MRISLPMSKVTALVAYTKGNREQGTGNREQGTGKKILTIHLGLVYATKLNAEC